MIKELVLPVGRLVGGHPMKRRGKTDKHNKPVLDDAGNQKTDIYIGFAVAKRGEQHWNQTAWGAQIWNEGLAAWPHGQYNAPTFAWKITDGDSQIPNKKGTKPCEREGYPGHWVLQLSTMLNVPCFHPGKYDPIQAIKNPAEIKAGDYCKVMIDVKGNDAAESPGLYLNPTAFELTQPGVEIILESMPDVATGFGGSSSELPPGAQVMTGTPAPAPPVQQAPAQGYQAPAPAQGYQPPVPPVQPDHTFLNPTPPKPEMYIIQGVAYPKQACIDAGYDVTTLPRA